MLFLYTTRIALTLSILSFSNALPTNKTDSQVEAAIDAGTFQDPSVNVRPRFRYWIPDASVNLSAVADDVKEIGRIGGGGMELIGYYLYGGVGGGLPTTTPVDWTVYGFGTPAWMDLFQTFTQAHIDNDLIMDIALGPNQGSGVPAEVGSDGLAWDLVSFNATVPIGGSFNGTLPGWGTLDVGEFWELQSATVGLVVDVYNGTVTSTTYGVPSYSDVEYKVLASSSLKDITDLVDDDGILDYTFQSNVTGKYYNLFVSYLIHSNLRTVQTPSELDGPESVPQNFIQNGSFVVDHYSSLGAQTTIDFLENYVLINGTKELVQAVGNYIWEDSIETAENICWTKDLPDNFLTKRGYSLSKYMPILFHDNFDAVKGKVIPVAWITDEEDGGQAHIDDFRETLAEGYADYLETFTTWAHEYLGIQYSAQVSYNLPMDMAARAPIVDAPECESLGFVHSIDGYRQYAGPGNLAGKRVISSELGTNELGLFAQSLPELLWDVKRSFAGSINQMVFHGAGYSGYYPNTTYPGFQTFAYLFSDAHSRHQPAWKHYSDSMDFVARNQLILQSGVPKVDIAFWNKRTEYFTIPTLYYPTDLEEAGFTYQYLSPDNFELPNAYVEEGILAPNAQAFKALVIRANDSMTVSGIQKLSEYAYAGLPIFFSGGFPETLAGYNASGMRFCNHTIQEIISLSNVHQVPYDDLASSISSTGITPNAKTSASAVWYTNWRKDTTQNADYVYIYYDDMSPSSVVSTGTIEFASTGYPYEFNAWTGVQSPITNFTRTVNTTIIPFTLAGNQSTIVAFLVDNTTVSSSTISTTKNPLTSLTLSNWSLTVEHWDAPTNLYDIEGVNKYNTTQSLPSLLPWSSIPALVNTSGVGFYTTAFSLPSQNQSVSIDFGSIIHTIRVFVNGQQLPPLDLTWAKADISTYVVAGNNTVEVVTATMLGNSLRNFWTEMETSGSSPTAPTPPLMEYGLVGDVVVKY